MPRISGVAPYPIALWSEPAGLKVERPADLSEPRTVAGSTSPQTVTLTSP